MDWWSNDARIIVRRGGEPDHRGRCVVYWMQRAQRAFDNPALEAAIRAANQIGKPVVVFFALLTTHPIANLRHYSFMIDGLIDTAHRLKRRGIGLIVRASTSPVRDFLEFCAEIKPALVVIDENPLRDSARWRVKVANAMRTPVLSVDADVIVPSILLQREHYAARTIRPRIQGLLAHYLRPVGNWQPRVKWKVGKRVTSAETSRALVDLLNVDRSVAIVPEIRGGTTRALENLANFVSKGLRGYSRQRNHPEVDGTSRLSPYLHFGHLGPHTVALAVLNSRAPTTDREAFLEELIVRRELAINFVRFNPDYDRLDSCERWARKTLRDHAGDKRSYRYSRVQLERAQTHDPLWNAAQRQMMRSGWMHGYVRMYWAKKILEWSRTPSEAFRIAIWLNDRYELDGRDPNGYAGIAWAIGGKHDRAWGPERPIYGMIRYMSLQSTSRKFDCRQYLSQWPDISTREK